MQVEVIDCTLRDGEQAPGVAFSVEEKARIAALLSRAGVNVLDAGFPASGGAEIETLQELRRLRLSASIGATARPVVGDIAAAEKAQADEVFLFMPTSDARIARTLGMSRTAALTAFRAGAEDVVGRGMGVNLVFEDATRADPGYLAMITEHIGGALPVRRVVVADSVGCATPERMRRLAGRIRSAGGEEIVVCPHCHNDFGLASANTLAAVEAGCTSITCTVNGLGERAGNADLAEVTAGLRHLYGIGHSVDLAALPALAELIERCSGMHTSFAKPVTGLNVFRHESGIHVDAMLKQDGSYEFLPAADLGRRTEFVLGKHSGRALLRLMLAETGAETKTGTATTVDEATVTRLLTAVKQRFDRPDRTQHDDLYQRRLRFFAERLSGIDRNALTCMATEADGPEPWC